jgi:hypothetical protein
LKDISAFDEHAMEEMFELAKTRALMRTQEETENKNLLVYETHEKVLRDLVTLFSRFKLG